MSFRGILAIIFLSIAAAIVFDFFKSYKASTNTGAQRIWDGARGSATMFVAQCGGVAMAIAAFADKITDFVCSLLNAPGSAEQIKSAISTYVTGQNLALAGVGFAVLVGWARMRTLSKPAGP